MTAIVLIHQEFVKPSLRTEWMADIQAQSAKTARQIDELVEEVRILADKFDRSIEAAIERHEKRPHRDAMSKTTDLVFLMQRLDRIEAKIDRLESK